MTMKIITLIILVLAKNAGVEHNSEINIIMMKMLIMIL